MKSKKTKKMDKKSCCLGLDLMIWGLAAFVGLAYMIIVTGPKLSGNQNVSVKSQSLTSQEERNKTLVTFVDEAANLIASQGTKAFPEFRKKGSKWWTGDSYIFVYDLTGITLVLPPQQNLEGTNRINVKDQNGVYFVKEMVNALKTKTSGWLSYVYPKPGVTTPSPKLSYFRKVSFGKQTVLVGSGIYTK